jgi:ferric-chelate reductase
MDSSILAATPSAADIALKEVQSRKYVKDLWIVLGSVIACLTVIRALRLAFAYLLSSKRVNPPAASAPASPVEKVDPEALNAPSSNQVSLRRIPTALASAFRVIAFRLNIPLGLGSKATIAELVFVLGYIAVMLTLLFVDSEFPTLIASMMSVCADSIHADGG